MSDQETTINPQFTQPAKKKLFFILISVVIFLIVTLFIITLFLNQSNKQNSFGITFTPQKYDQTPTDPTAVYQKGRDLLAHGRVTGINKDMPWIELQGTNKTVLKTKLVCGGKIVEIYINNGQKKTLSLKDALPDINIGDQFFGICGNKSCQQLSTCTLIKLL